MHNLCGRIDPALVVESPMRNVNFEGHTCVGRLPYRMDSRTTTLEAWWYDVGTQPQAKRISADRFDDSSYRRLHQQGTSQTRFQRAGSRAHPPGRTDPLRTGRGHDASRNMASACECLETSVFVAAIYDHVAVWRTEFYRQLRFSTVNTTGTELL